MSVITKLLTLKGLEKYQYYTEVLRRWDHYKHYNLVKFQYDDWLFMDEVDEAVFVRACGGSKTFDGVNWLVLRCSLSMEKWAWLASASGQLQQARIYFREHPFVKSIKGTVGTEVINLYNGNIILLRGATASITGLRLDGIMLDEEEMLQPRQVEIVYPQLHGRLTFSSIGKFFHLGTMQADAALFMGNIDKYPKKIHPWDECPWLVKAGHIQRLIDEGHTPEHTIDMLYRCIPTIPGGVFFHRLKEIEPYDYDPELVQYGIDFGGTDHVVGVIIDGDVCTVVEEREVDIEAYNDCLDDLAGHDVQAEGGMYNDDRRYSAKCQMMVRRINAKRQLPLVKWKKDTKMYARHFREIRVIKKNCPNTYIDMKSTTFGLDDLWLKDKRHPCHWVDAFMMALGSGLRGQVFGVNEKKKELDRFRYISKMRKNK